MKILRQVASIRIVYMIVFMSLVFWAYFAYHTMSEQIKNQEIYAKIINLSGKQRMLSQKTALISNRVFFESDKKLESHLKSLIIEMKADHKFIITNLSSKNMENIYFSKPYDLNTKVSNYINLLESYFINKNSTILKNIIDTSYDLLPKLNFAVYEFEKESNEATKALLQRERYIFIGTLLTLIIESIFIVFPIIRRAEEKEKELVELNSTLEKRIEDEIKTHKEKDEIIFEQSKMTSMGEVLQNISHQWRQPLSVITTAASGMKLKKDFNTLEDNDFDEFINQIMINSNYLSQTIDDFRDFYSRNKDKNNFNLSELLEKSIKILDINLKRKNINIITEFEKDDKVYGFENELLQVFLNLLGNSIEALESTNYEYKFIKIITKKENEHVFIEFIDNANGIDENIKDKIFEAYFTTKYNAKGTGIGLYMSYEIITKHFNGTITQNNITTTQNNESYQGSCFKITIPTKIV